MKTRNNDSTPNETLLNQNITRRSFVKRGAVASAATVFGVGIGTISARAAVVNDFLGSEYEVAAPSSQFQGHSQSASELQAHLLGMQMAGNRGPISTIPVTYDDYLYIKVPRRRSVLRILPQNYDGLLLQPNADGSFDWHWRERFSFVIITHRIIPIGENPDTYPDPEGPDYGAGTHVQ